MTQSGDEYRSEVGAEVWGETQKHAKYSPSSAGRWVNCPGYTRLLEKVIEQFGEEPSSDAASEGTRMHELAAQLLGERNPTKALKEDKAIDPEDRKALWLYVDTVEDFLDFYHRGGGSVDLYIEQRVTADDKLYGTADCVIKHDTGITVIDYKNGRGVRVDPDSLQLKLYGYMAYLSHFSPDSDGERNIELVIVQPHYLEKGVPLVRTEAYSAAALLNEMEGMLDSVHKGCFAADAEYAEGDHCRFCYAKPLCPRKKEKIEMALKCDPNVQEDLQFLLDNKKELYDILKRAQGLAIAGLENGTLDGKTMGYGLAPSLGNRKWDYEGPESALASLLRRHGVDKNEVWDKKVISPAKAAKLVDDKEWLKKYVSREDKGVKLVAFAKADASLHGRVQDELASFEPGEKELSALEAARKMAEKNVTIPRRPEIFEKEERGEPKAEKQPEQNPTFDEEEF